MYDMHYDLLTILYYNLKQNNPKANVEKLIDDCLKIYKNNNILGGIINLYFMSEEEMQEELGIEEYELKDVYKMFEKSVEYFKLFQEKGFIPNDIDYIYGIEGCDYFTDENDLTRLYQLGLRSIIPVWNNESKFGSGIRSDKGLTELGIKLIKKAIELGIIIDISHANEKTFFDIIDVIKKEQEKGKKVSLIASHSNVRTLCDRKRNLTDEELITLRDTGGYIGLFTNGNFLSLDNTSLTYKQRIENFIKHLKYIIYEIGFDTSKIIISTDDMNLNSDPIYHNLEVYPLELISSKLYQEIKVNFGEEIANNLLINNSKKLIEEVRKQERIKVL